MTLGIAIYGKGGSGKSSIAAALSSCFADRGLRVLHLGCDPKSDSSRLLVPSGSERTSATTVTRIWPNAERNDEPSASRSVCRSDGFGFASNASLQAMIAAVRRSG